MNYFIMSYYLIALFIIKSPRLGSARESQNIKIKISTIELKI